MNKPLSINEVVFLFSSLWRANVPEWLPSPRLNLSFDDNHLKWSLSATQKGTWLALGILIGLSLVLANL